MDTPAEEFDDQTAINYISKRAYSPGQSGSFVSRRAVLHALKVFGLWLT